jgi:hypothetical protein
LRTPICTFDAMNGILCPQCESKLDSGKLTKTDVEAAIKLVHLSKKIPRFPIDTDKVISIVKDLRRIDLVVEFERK